MQLFRSEDDVATWAARTGNAVGAVFSPHTLWALSQRWWDDRLELRWRRRTEQERQAILSDVGLDGPFWDLSATRSPGD